MRPGALTPRMVQEVSAGIAIVIVTEGYVFLTLHYDRFLCKLGSTLGLAQNVCDTVHVTAIGVQRQYLVYHVRKGTVPVSSFSPFTPLSEQFLCLCSLASQAILDMKKMLVPNDPASRASENDKEL